ncbi:hypothetical protein MPSEU_000769200 [Mayamaea pseudoterrestris]|nr:hypothetical protein MPSEU_000769200 [Mayamaea pseudoterrestris]
MPTAQQSKREKARLKEQRNCEHLRLMSRGYVKSWPSFYKRLKAYKGKYGIMAVPSSSRTDSSLYQFVMSQRNAFVHGTLLPSRLIKLERHGFIWNIRKAEEAWQKKAKELSDYKDKVGNCNVPLGESHDHAALALWVFLMRYKYKNKTLEENRIHQLNKIGIDWDWMPKLASGDAHCMEGTESQSSSDESDDDECASYTESGTDDDSESSGSKYAFDASAAAAAAAAAAASRGDVEILAGEDVTGGATRGAMTGSDDGDLKQSSKRHRSDSSSSNPEKVKAKSPYEAPNLDASDEPRRMKKVRHEHAAGIANDEVKEQEEEALADPVYSNPELNLTRWFEDAVEVPILRTANGGHAITGSPSTESCAFSQRLWFENFDRLAAHIEEQGHMHDLSTPLRRWSKRQRLYLRNGCLMTQQVLALEELGFIWFLDLEKEEHYWQHNYQILLTCRKQWEQCLRQHVMEDFLTLEFRLWAVLQKAQYKTRTLSSTRTDQLNAIGFLWNFSDACDKPWENEKLEEEEQPEYGNMDSVRQDVAMPLATTSAAADERFVRDASSGDGHCRCYKCMNAQVALRDDMCTDWKVAHNKLKRKNTKLQAEILELKKQQRPVVAATAEQRASQQSSSDEKAALKVEIRLLQADKAALQDKITDLEEAENTSVQSVSAMRAKIRDMRFKIYDLEKQVSAQAKWPTTDDVNIDDDVFYVPWDGVSLTRGNATLQISSPAAHPRVDTNLSPLKAVVLHYIQAYLNVKNSRVGRLELARIQPMTHENLRRFGVEYVKASPTFNVPKACTAQRVIHYLTSQLANAIRKSGLPVQPAIKGSRMLDAWTFFAEDKVHDFLKVMHASSEGAGRPWRLALEDEHEEASDEAWGKYVARLFLCCSLCEMCQNQSYERISICHACAAERRKIASQEVSRFVTEVRSIFKNKFFRTKEDTVFRTMLDDIIPGSDEDLVFNAVVALMAAIQLTNLKRISAATKGFAPDDPPKKHMDKVLASAGEKMLKNRLLEVRGARAKVNEPTIETDQTLFALYKEATSGERLGWNNKSVFRIFDGDDSCVVAIFKKPL